MDTFIIILVGFVAVFGLYWLLARAIRVSQRRQMRRQGKAIPWVKALEQVKRADGFFILGISGGHRELFYATGELPKDVISANNAYQQRAMIVEGYAGRHTLVDLKTYGAVDRCIELNLDSLVV